MEKRAVCNSVAFLCKLEAFLWNCGHVTVTSIPVFGNNHRHCMVISKRWGIGHRNGKLFKQGLVNLDGWI